MNFEDHFRNADIKEAKQEFSCAVDLITLITLNTRSGNAKRAKVLTEDLLNTLANLTKLTERKLADDEYKALIDRMIQQGNVERVKIHFGAQL